MQNPNANDNFCCQAFVQPVRACLKLTQDKLHPPEAGILARLFFINGHVRFLLSLWFAGSGRP